MAIQCTYTEVVRNGSNKFKLIKTLTKLQKNNFNLTFIDEFHLNCSSVDCAGWLLHDSNYFLEFYTQIVYDEVGAKCLLLYLSHKTGCLYKFEHRLTVKHRRSSHIVRSSSRTHTHTYQKSIRKRTKPFYKHIHTVTGNTDAHSLVRERNSLRNIGPYAAKLSIGKTSRSSEKKRNVCVTF